MRVKEKNESLLNKTVSNLEKRPMNASTYWTEVSKNLKCSNFHNLKRVMNDWAMAQIPHVTIFKRLANVFNAPGLNDEQGDQKVCLQNRPKFYPTYNIYSQI
jgi:hypothetical protein